MGAFDFFSRLFGSRKMASQADIVRYGGFAAQFGDEKTDESGAVTWYRDAAWVYRCVDVRAKNIGGVNWDIINIADDEPVAEEHPFRTLLTKVNDTETFTQLMITSESWLALRGNSYWELATARPNAPTSPTNPPLEIFHLEPDNMSVEVDPKEGISGYTYAINFRKVKFRKDQVIHHKYFNPLSTKYGLSPLSALRYTLASDLSALKWNKNFFTNSAVPRVLLSPKRDEALTDAEVEQIARQWRELYKGEDNAHKTAAMPIAMDVNQLSMSAKDAEFLGLRQVNKEEICAVFGVPLPIAGDLSRATYNNITRAEKILWDEALVPELNFIADNINENLGVYFPGTKFVWNADSIVALQEDATERHTRIINMNNHFLESFKAKAITVDELRAILNQTLADFDIDGVDLTAPMPEPEPVLALPDPDPVVEEEGEPEPAQLPPPKMAEVPEQKVLKPLRVRENRERLAQLEKRFERRLAAVLASEAKRVSKELSRAIRPFLPDAKSAKAKKLTDAVLRKLMKDLQLDQKWFAQLKAVMHASMSSSFKSAGVDVFAALGDDVPPTINALATKYAEDHAAELVGMRKLANGRVVVNPNPKFAITEATRKTLRGITTRAVDGGWSTNRFATEVLKSQKFTRARALRIATYEVGQSYTQGSLAAYKESGVVESKGWLSVRDDRVRPEHQSLDAAQPIPIKSSWSEGEPPTDPGCRCRIIPFVDVKKMAHVETHEFSPFEEIEI